MEKQRTRKAQGIPSYFVLFGLLILALYRFQNLSFSRLQPIVSYDNRSILINGERTLILAGHVHYPRSTPEMWPDLFRKAKEGGLNAIDTYVFWNEHEHTRGSYDFTGSKDIRTFIKEAQKAGLYVVLRIGPYVCAEYNFGGFPSWLRDIPGIDVRNYNEPFVVEMKRFVTDIVDYLRDLMFYNGGPIILLQIENEYGHVQNDYNKGQEYIEWAVGFAKDLEPRIPWFVCQQFGSVKNILDTCNGFYCDNWIESRPYKDQPAMLVEHWTGWYQLWGEAKPYRHAEDVAFSVARFFARGGTYNGYYMYHGGTNFGRIPGGPGITTSYDYDAPLDEYGFKNEPKYSHLASLHSMLFKYSKLILLEAPTRLKFESLEGHLFGNLENDWVLFVSNIDVENDHQLEFKGKKYHIPKWSVSILSQEGEMCNTAKTPSTTERTYSTILNATSGIITRSKELFPELGKTVIKPLEQISFTHDETDYLWYTTKLNTKGTVYIEIFHVYDYASIYLDDVLVGHSKAQTAFKVETTITEPKLLRIRTQTLGIINFGPHLQAWKRGILGYVKINGNIVKNWSHQAGLSGPLNFTLYNSKVAEDSFWYEIKLPAIEIDERFAYALDLSSMGKGQVYINGNHLGRYWNILASEGPTIRPHHYFTFGDKKCEYSGPYNDKKCRYGYGEPSQQYYHVPRGWIQKNNVVRIFEENGGDLSNIKLVQISRE